MEVVSRVIDAIAEVPLAVWSAVGTALVSYMTMKVSNGHSAKQLAMQLQHDAEQKSIERRAMLRRDVYLPAAEAAVKLNGRMGTLPQTDLSNAETQLDLANFSAAMMQLQVVGEPDTAALASEVLAVYGEAFMQCLPKAAKIQMERSRAKDNERLYDDMQLQVKRVLAEMTALNETGNSDAAKFQRLQQSFEFFSKQAADWANARKKHQEAEQALQLQYLQEVVPMMKHLNTTYVPLIVAIRHELGFGGELRQFQQMLEMQISRVEQASSKLLQELDVRKKGDSIASA